jgi:hypothetical protein
MLVTMILATATKQLRAGDTPIACRTFDDWVLGLGLGKLWTGARAIDDALHSIGSMGILLSPVTDDSPELSDL